MIRFLLHRLGGIPTSLATYSGHATLRLRVGGASPWPSRLRAAEACSRGAGTRGIGFSARLIPAVLGLTLALSATQGQQPRLLGGSADTPASANEEGVVGLVLGPSWPYPVVSDILVGGSAATNALIERGMSLIAIADGGRSARFVSTSGLSVREVAKLLGGRPGTKVALRVSRDLPDGTGETHVVELERLPLSRVQRDGIFRGTDQTNFALSTVRDAAPGVLHADQGWGPSTNAIQPPHVSWRKTKYGMTEREVEDLLGKPLRVRGGPRGAHVWDYGYVVLASQVMPLDLTFSVWFNKGRVIALEDPFHGSFSTNGAPSKPVLISPHDNEAFSHYPRIVDLRWYPVSGDYPVRYEIQVDTAAQLGWVPTTYESVEPYAAIVLPGSNRARWRVRAKNNLGTGPWSEYSHFEFSQ